MCGCSDKKRRFSSKRHAKEHAKYVHKHKPSISLYPYFCVDCDCWRLTSRKRSMVTA